MLVVIGILIGLAAGGVLGAALLRGWQMSRLAGAERSKELILAEAERRAEALLRSMLSREEFNCLCLRGYLEVPSPSIPNRVYRIPNARGQVEVFEDDQLVMKLCVVPTKSLPEGDLVLMHKLMIEGNEEEYLRVANRFEPTLYGFIAIRPRGRL